MIITIRTILVTCLMLSIAWVSTSQTDANTFEFGIKAGAQRSNLSDSNGKPKIAPIGGIFAEFHATENFAVRSELSYAPFGVKSKGSFQQMKLNYVQILPGSAKFYPTENLSVEAGPYGGYLLSSKSNIGKSNLRKLDYGGTLGIGYRFTSNIELGARYYLGLRDITKTIGKIKNRAFQLALSYRF